MSQRYAIYYAPEAGSPLANFGARWIGRDAASGKSCMQYAVSGVADEDLHRLTSTPRHYGFHATLKPPFALATGRTPQELMRALGDFAASRMPVSAPALMLDTIGSFLALRPSAISRELDIFAAECVTLFDGFRALEPASQIQKRKEAGLTPRQITLLERFGYPYVLDEFRIHMTLTNKIPDEILRKRLLKGLDRATAGLTRDPFMIREICVFHQPSKQEPFTLIKRFPLAGKCNTKPTVQAQAI